MKDGCVTVYSLYRSSSLKIKPFGEPSNETFANSITFIPSLCAKNFFTCIGT